MWALLFSISTWASAQESEKAGDPDALVFRVELGFGGELRPNRWNPVRVWVSSGSRAAEGTVELRYATDPTQEHRVSAPFTTTPGMMVPVNLLICPFEGTDKVTISLVPNHGRRPKSIRFSIYGGGSDTQFLSLRDGNEAVLLSVGDTGIRFATSTRDARSMLDPDSEDPYASVFRPGQPASSSYLWNSYAKVVRLRPLDEPTHWGAYDAAEMIVIRAVDSEMLAPGAIEQIKIWIRSGGRLILLVDDPGVAWQRWFESDFESPPVRLDEMKRQPLSPEVVRIVTALQLELPDGVGPSPADDAPSRAIQLTDVGKAHGWRLHWRNDVTADAAPVGFIAEGPMGFGMVTVLGVDPANAPAVLSSLATGLLWQEAVQRNLEDWQQTTSHMLGSNTGWGQPNSTVDIANSEVVTSLVDFDSVGGLAFLLIVVGILALAMLLGPIDAYVLKRLRQRHRSWLTALLWITLAGCISWLAPSVIQSGPARIRQMQVVDVVQPIAPSAAALTSQAEIFGIFANQSGRAVLDPTDHAVLTSGVSALSGMFAQQKSLSGVFDVTQHLSLATDEGQPSGSALSQVRLNLWTFRTFLSRSPPTYGDAPLRAVLSRDSEQLSVVIEGLPASALVNNVLVQMSDGFHRARGAASMSTEEGDDQMSWEGVASLAGRSRVPEGWGAVDTHIDPTRVWNPWGGVQFQPNSAFSIAGAARRRLSIQQRVQSGRWACVYVDIANMPASLGITGWSVEGKRSTLVRILVAIAQEDALSPNGSFLRMNGD